jgi:hypothetical protein
MIVLDTESFGSKLVTFSEPFDHIRQKREKDMLQDFIQTGLERRVSWLCHQALHYTNSGTYDPGQ